MWIAGLRLPRAGVTRKFGLRPLGAEFGFQLPALTVVVRTLAQPGEIYFGWVLQGRAIQDVWILPGVFYGTTLRVYDPGLEAWHILWSDPLCQLYTRQIGRADGSDIVQIGKNDQGVMLRWRFVDTTPNSFRWLGERSYDDGKSWQLEAEFRAQRA